MADKSPAGLITSTAHEKVLADGDELKAVEKHPGGCEDCIDCGECEAIVKLDRLRRQNSLVSRLDKRVRQLLEKALVS